MFTSWMSPKLAAADVALAGRGSYARVEIAPGEVVVAFGGKVVAGDVFAALPAQRRSLSIQVADDLYLVGAEVAEPHDMVNHSCDPNCGILGSIMLVAMRPIAAGEELHYDYAMSDGSPYDEFDCSCGAAECRGRVTGERLVAARSDRTVSGLLLRVSPGPHRPSCVGACPSSADRSSADIGAEP